MALEKLMQGVLSANPTMRKKLEAVLNGTGHIGKPVQNDLRLVTISGAARLLDIGRSTVYKLIESGRLDTVAVNGLKRVTMKSITAFVDGERLANENTGEFVASSKAHCATTKGEEV